MAGSRSKYSEKPASTRKRSDFEEDEPELSNADSSSLENLNQIFNSLVKIFVIAIFLLGVYYGIRVAYQFGYSVFTVKTAEEAPGTDKEVTILEGMSSRNVSLYLQEQGLIADSRIFYVQTVIYGYEIQPGTYTLNTSQTIYEMLRILSAKTS